MKGRAKGDSSFMGLAFIELRPVGVLNRSHDFEPSSTRTPFTPSRVGQQRQLLAVSSFCNASSCSSVQAGSSQINPRPPPILINQDLIILILSMQ